MSEHKRKSKIQENTDKIKKNKLEFNIWDEDVVNKVKVDNVKEKTPQKTKLEHDIWNNSKPSLKEIKIGDLKTGKW